MERVTDEHHLKEDDSRPTSAQQPHAGGINKPELHPPQVGEEFVGAPSYASLKPSPHDVSLQEVTSTEEKRQLLLHLMLTEVRVPLLTERDDVLDIERDRAAQQIAQMTEAELDHKIQSEEHRIRKQIATQLGGRESSAIP